MTLDDNKKPHAHERTLRHDEPIPDGVPLRCMASSGYVVLKWKTGTMQYVMELEHRVVAGRPHGLVVHHINGNRSDNRPENLQVLTRREHRMVHTAVNYGEAVALYHAGWTLERLAQRYGRSVPTIYVGLKHRGVPLRTSAETRALRKRLLEATVKRSRASA